MERHFEELRLELRREDSRPSPEQAESSEGEEKRKENETEWPEKGQSVQESSDIDKERGRQERAGIEDGEFSQRVHELYREFLCVVSANLGGIIITAILYARWHTKKPERAADTSNVERTPRNSKTNKCSVCYCLLVYSTLHGANQFY